MEVEYEDEEEQEENEDEENEENEKQEAEGKKPLILHPWIRLSPILSQAFFFLLRSSPLLVKLFPLACRN